ncbi:unnamed protein product [Peronospora destructor]|uniref:Protein-serine/threonine kinase n=1 Tax=Peronospora destructor TaxID=86335 RepID=A0AAV0VEH0_9STRA|nr:unnamed protein product [Peronospora destructor]
MLRRSGSSTPWAIVLGRLGHGRCCQSHNFDSKLYVSHEKPIPMDQVRQIAETEPTPLSLQQMRSFSDGCAKLRLVSAKFLHKELQSRFAQADDRQFTDTLREAKAQGSNLVPLICYGLHQLKGTDLGHSALQIESAQEDIKDRLDKFFLGRIGIRMLIGQHVESLERPGGRVHLVNVEEIVREACDRATNLCIQYSGVAPPVEIHATASAGTPLMYVRSHLHHMVFELVKNAMRATQTMNLNSPSLGFFLPPIDELSGVKIFPDVSKYKLGEGLPPVEIVICVGSEDLTIKVSDEGGGVPRSRWNKLWHYDYTTSFPYPPIDCNNYHSYRQHYSGGGYGLPMARLFARYFGGEVTFSSLEGSGSTGFIQAHRLGTNVEVVPGHASFNLPPLYS